MSNCSICPRNCVKSRNKGDLGYCRVHNEIMVARAALHMWEEPCISSKEGSGAVFFSGCNMGCVFCQNSEISRGKKGTYISADRLSDIFLELEQKGANNINLVTPSHYVFQIIKAIEISRKKGMNLPVVYNTSSYEKVDTLKYLEGYIDIFLPDCKYYDNERAIKYSNAPDYYKIALSAIKEMYRQVGAFEFDERGIMKKGVIIRHMILPEGKRDSKEVLRRLYGEFGDNVYFSIMSQYTPMESVDYERYPELRRRVTKREYNCIVDYAIELGIENAFVQEGESAKESFIPDFDMNGVINVCQ